MQLHARMAESVRDGDGEGGAFFGIGGRAELVEQHQGAGSASREMRSRLTMWAEKLERLLLDGLRVADVGVDGSEEREVAASAGTGMPAWAIRDEQAPRS